MLKINRLAISWFAVQQLFIISIVPGSAKATVFLQVTDAELQSTCNSAVIGNKECFTTQVLAWTPESDNLTNPCFHNGNNQCWVFSGLRNLGSNGWVVVDEAVDAINMPTVGDVRKAFIEKNPLPFQTTLLSQTVATGVCAAILYGPGGRSGGGYYINLDGPAQVYPTSICAAPPPPIGACKISGDVIINYGNISSEKLSGLHASGHTTIQCDATTEVNFMAYSPSDGSNIVSLKNDGSLSAKLTIDGAAANKGKIFDVQADSPVDITIDSELIKNGSPETGPFSGNAIAILSLP